MRYLSYLGVFVLGAGTAAALMAWLYYASVERQLREVRRELHQKVHQAAQDMARKIIWGEDEDNTKGGD